jgi:site-specific DNA-adenine methylase
MNVAHLYKKVITNDYLKDLIEIHKNLNNEDFIKKASELSIKTKMNKEFYLELRDNYNKNKKPEELLALIWSCNSNMMRFNNDLLFNQTWGKRSFNKNTQKKIDIYKEQNYSNVIFTSKNFYEFDLSWHSDELFIYLDPPYSNTEA